MTDDQNTKPKRRTLTLQEREAKLKAELAKLRGQARVKDEKKLAVLIEENDKLQARINDLNAKLRAQALDIAAIRQRLDGDQDD